MALNIVQISEFQLILSAWGYEHIRSFPWRYSNDPYQILVSEFMLHRTQALQVVPIFEKYLVIYPTLSVFAQTHSENIRKLLYPLGLAWRTEGMISALFELWHIYGEVPLNYEKLLSIRGIGQYIAGATLCFSLNKPFVLVDTNVVRVIGRVFGIDLKGEARRRRTMLDTIANVLDQSSPRDFYYSLIDLAHTVCLHNIPSCTICPFFEFPCQFSDLKI